MFRQVSSRNHRSKGLKVIHVLQMCLLLAICIWLLYQVKHSHDKKEVLDENNLEFANKIDDDHRILIFGRKDLNYGVEMASKNGKQGEEEESEEEEIDGSHEILKLGRKDLNLGVEMASKDEKHGKEEESEEREEGNGEENVNKERGAGDDEIDEHDLVEVDEEADRGEYLTDVEKEDIGKELEKEEKGGHIEHVDSSENHDRDDDDRNSQEALEEHYRDDDASSAVVRDNHMIRSEIENEESRNSKEVHLDNIEKFNLENEHETNRTEDSPVDKNDSNPNASKSTVFMEDGEKAIEKPSVNAANDEKGVEVSQSKLENEPLSNMTTTESSNQTALHDNATVGSTETSSLYLKSKTTILDSTKDQNATFEVAAFDKEEPNAETLGLKQTEKSNATIIAEDTETTVLEQTETSNATGVVKEANNVVLEQTSAVEKSQEVKSEQTEKSNTTNIVEESDDNTMSSLATSENSDAIRTENTDSLSTMVTEEEKDSLIDLGTLPQIESEGRNTEDALAE